MTRALLERHEKAYGASNRMVELGKDLLFLQLNTMALEEDVQDRFVHYEAWQCVYIQSIYEDKLHTIHFVATSVRYLNLYRANYHVIISMTKEAQHEQLRRFLTNVEASRARHGFQKQLVLLTHVPLYRPNDLLCGNFVHITPYLYIPTNNIDQ
jgi:hypothetical protein